MVERRIYQKFEALPFSTERQVRNVRGLVETALQDQFGRRPTSFIFSPRFAGKLSTDPSRVSPEVTDESLHDMCTSLTTELAQCLDELGQPVERSGTSPHEFLFLRHRRIVRPEILIVIDPSIGQLVRGHNHVFVGTEKHLRDTLTNQSENLLRKASDTETPEDFFERNWGYSLPK